MYTVSIIIPLYNTEKYIVDTLDSISKQSIKSIEILVVDDSSTDKGPELVAEYIKKKNRSVKLMKNQSKKGVSGARNTGIKQAKGKYIGFLDSDDILLYPDALQDKVDVLEEFERLNFVSSDFLKFTDGEILPQGKGYFEEKIKEELEKNISYPWGYHIEDPVHFYLKTACLAITSSVLISREHLNNVGFFDENLTHGEDIELWYRLSLDQEFGFIKASTFGYRIRPGSATSDERKTRLGSYYVRKKIFFDKRFIKYKDIAKARLKDESQSLIYYFRKNKKFSSALQICFEMFLLDPTDINNIKQIIAVLVRRS